MVEGGFLVPDNMCAPSLMFSWGVVLGRLLLPERQDTFPCSRSRGALSAWLSLWLLLFPVLISAYLSEGSEDHCVFLMVLGFLSFLTAEIPTTALVTSARRQETFTSEIQVLLEKFYRYLANFIFK